jgi:large subunit ribosomal protein L13
MKNKATVSVTVSDNERAWWVIDLAEEALPLGRVASRIAGILRGKHKPAYTSHNDTGDFVIVLNVGQAKFTGNKEAQKEYHHHTGYLGGLKTITAEKLRAEKPEAMITKAVKGMLPKNTLGRQMFTKLKVYAGGDHPHAAQQPQPLDISKF